MGVHGPEFLPLLIIASQAWGSLRASPADGAVVRARPPPWFFGVVWTAVVVVLSAVWWAVCETARTKTNRPFITAAHSLLVATVALCLAWLAVYHAPCGKTGGVYVLWMLVAVLAALGGSAVALRLPQGIALALPVTWAVYAAVMNMIEVQHETIS